MDARAGARGADGGDAVEAESALESQTCRRQVVGTGLSLLLVLAMKAEKAQKARQSVDVAHYRAGAEDRGPRLRFALAGRRRVAPHRSRKFKANCPPMLSVHPEFQRRKLTKLDGHRHAEYWPLIQTVRSWSQPAAVLGCRWQGRVGRTTHVILLMLIQHSLLVSATFSGTAMILIFWVH